VRVLVCLLSGAFLAGCGLLSAGIPLSVAYDVDAALRLEWVAPSPRGQGLAPNGTVEIDRALRVWNLAAGPLTFRVERAEGAGVLLCSAPGSCAASLGPFRLAVGQTLDVGVRLDADGLAAGERIEASIRPVDVRGDP